MKPETAAIHVPDHRRDGAISPPIHLSTTFEHAPEGGSAHGFDYIRSGNPNVNDLEARLTAMEGGADCTAFGSGMAAGAALLATLPRDARVIFHDDLYYDFRALARDALPGWGLRADFVNLRDESALDAALSDGAALVWLESPSNPGLELVDIEAVAAKAADAGAKTLVDGTFATPALQQPLTLSADYVLHSLTKYMGGHSDIQGGAVIVKDDPETAAALKRVRSQTGGVLAPFNAWLVSRGLQTLHCRMETHSRNALCLAEALAAHDRVERVRYPFLSAHPDFALAQRQMRAGGGMVSVEVKGGREAALAVAGRVRLFANATSLGGVESLIEHRASIEGPGSKAPPGLLRLSVGLENCDDLIADLEQALGGV